MMVSGSLTDLLRKLLRVGEDNGVQHPTKALLLFAITGLVYVTVCLRFGLVSSTNHIVAAHACSDGDLELARARESSILLLSKTVACTICTFQRQDPRSRQLCLERYAQICPNSILHSTYGV